MDCLNDYIGLQGCGSSTPDSGLYLNDLAGIQLRQIDEIANEDQVNYTGVWDKVQARGIKRFEKDVRKAMMEKTKLKGVTQSINLGKGINTSTTRGSAAEYRGATIELNDASHDWVDSNFQVIFIQTINIYLPGAGTFNVKIYDLDKEDALAELYTESVTVTAAGWKAVNINDFYLSSRRIFVAYDCTSINSVELDIDDFNLNCYTNCGAKVKGGYSSTGTPTDITETTNNTHGLSVVFSVQCKYDVMVCNNKDIFAQALLYCLGAEMMLEIEMSSRTTRWTMLDAKQVKYLRQYYTAIYKGGIFEEMEYNGELYDAVDLMNPNPDDCCIQCVGKLSFQDALL